MADLLTAAQMRAIEGAQIGRGAVTGLELMERAGRGVVEAVFAQWPHMAATPQRALVLCGPGNNGGDGFVVARLLKGWGWSVEVVLYGDPEALPPDAAANHARWCDLGEVTVHPIGASVPGGAEGKGAVAAQGPVNLLVDALFGTGLTRHFAGLEAIMGQGFAKVQADDATRARVVAVDMPSGLCSDSGRVLGDVVEADLTVAFHRAKLGHYLAQGPERCGRLVVHPIGLEEAPAPGAPAVQLVEQAALAALGKPVAGHKYAHGHALVLTGGAGRTGAARLAARAALRVGAGLVTLGVPGSAQQEVACQITALMLRRVEHDPERQPGLTELLADDRINALCLGPGLGLERAHALVPIALRAAHAPCVLLDADALTAFEASPDALFALLHKGCVLTPHGGEFARLFPDLAQKLSAPAEGGPAYSKLEATREAAARAGCTVLFKGADTVIAGPEGRASVVSAQYESRAPWLATAGSGDVLAGLITGLLARGLGPMDAAQTGAWLHVACARRFGPGLIAEDLPEQVPHVLAHLGA